MENIPEDPNENVPETPKDDKMPDLGLNRLDQVENVADSEDISATTDERPNLENSGENNVENPENSAENTENNAENSGNNAENITEEPPSEVFVSANSIFDDQQNETTAAQEKLVQKETEETEKEQNHKKDDNSSEKIVFKPTDIELIEPNDTTDVDFASQPLASVSMQNIKICCMSLTMTSWIFISCFIINVINIFDYLSDIIMDIVVAVQHHKDGNHWWSALTLLFVFLPSLMFALYAVYKQMFHSKLSLPRKICTSFLFFFSSFFLMLWPVWRYANKAYYGWKATRDPANKQEYLEKLESFNTKEAAVQSMLKTFLESAPQFLLQFYILLTTPPEEQNTLTVTLQIVSTVLSIHAMAETAIDFNVAFDSNKGRPMFEPDKTVKILTTIVEFLWWMAIITSRMLALGLFASVFPKWVFFILLMHCAIMCGCLAYEQQEKRASTFIIIIFLSLAYIFFFVRYKVHYGELQRTIVLYGLYYSFSFIQNTCIILVAYFCIDVQFWYHTPIVVGYFASFFIGVGFMIIYLVYLRPRELRNVQEIIRGSIVKSRKSLEDNKA